MENASIATEVVIASVKVITPGIETPSGDSFITVNGDTTNFGNNSLQLSSPAATPPNTNQCYVVSKMFNVTTAANTSGTNTVFYSFTIPQNTVLNISLESAISSNDVSETAILNSSFRLKSQGSTITSTLASFIQRLSEGRLVGTNFGISINTTTRVISLRAESVNCPFLNWSILLQIIYITL